MTRFKDDLQVAVLRRWMCDLNSCHGELKRVASKSEPYAYQHVCSICARPESADRSYPAIVFLPFEDSAE